MGLCCLSLSCTINKIYSATEKYLDIERVKIVQQKYINCNIFTYLNPFMEKLRNLELGNSSANLVHNVTAPIYGYGRSDSSTPPNYTQNSLVLKLRLLS